MSVPKSSEPTWYSVPIEAFAEAGSEVDLLTFAQAAGNDVELEVAGVTVLKSAVDGLEPPEATPGDNSSADSSGCSVRSAAHGNGAGQLWGLWLALVALAGSRRRRF